jgi:hypothetical protein
MLKQRVPWPFKFTIKLALGAAGVNYRLLKRMALVEHGRMDRADFAQQVFEQHVAGPLREWRLAAAGTLLEIGPGDSVATGILGRASGFSAVELIDAGPFADLRPAALDRLFASLGAEELSLPRGATGEQVIARLRDRGIVYRTSGVRALEALGTGSIAYSFSNTVLQHVHRNELPELVHELGRVHAAGSAASHLVNFTDHFSGGYVNQRLPDWFMESALIKRAHLYTNRVAALPLLDLFESAGFTVLRLPTEFSDLGTPQRCEFRSVEEFRAGVGSRRILRVFYLLRRR